MVEQSEKETQKEDTRYLRKRNKTWWFRKTVGTREISFTLETTQLRRAQKGRDAVLAQMEAGTFEYEKPETHTFNDLIEEFTQDAFQHIRKKTRDRYVSNIKMLLESLDGLDLTEIDFHTLKAYEIKRRASGVSNGTIMSDLRCLSSMFRTAKDLEWVTVNPVQDFLDRRAQRTLKTPTLRTRYLSSDEERDIVAKAGDKAAQMILFAIDTGLRREEQFSLPWANVSLENRWIYISPEIAKSSRERYVPLLPRAESLLKAISRDKQSPYVFTSKTGTRYTPSSPTIYDALQSAVSKANIEEHVQWHDLRRTCGCRLLQDYGLEMHEVSAWLGHSSVTVTERHYAFVKTQKLQNKVDKRSEEIRAQIRGEIGTKHGTRSREHLKIV